MESDDKEKTFGSVYNSLLIGIQFSFPFRKRREAKRIRISTQPLIQKWRKRAMNVRLELTRPDRHVKPKEPIPINLDSHLLQFLLL